MWGELLSIAVIVCILAVAYRVRKLVRRVIVWEYERGLKFHKGKFKGALGTGLYWVYTATTRIHKFDMRPQEMTVAGQEVLSADSIGLKVSVVAKYEVIDPYTAFSQARYQGVDPLTAHEDAFFGIRTPYCEALYLPIQMAIREIIGTQPIDDLLENRQSFDTTLIERCAKEYEELGFKLHWVRVRDIIFPGDLKKVFAKVVEARKEGQAALEKARGETAALRSLANAAKLVENNPGLLHLRTIQAVTESNGNTLVMGVPTGSVVIPVKSKSVPEQD